MLIRSLIFFLLVIFLMIGILNNCTQDQTWLVKFNTHDREYRINIKEVKADLLIMIRRQRHNNNDLEWHKNYLFSKYLSEDIAVLEELSTEKESYNINNSTEFTTMKKNKLDQFRQKFRASFSEIVLPNITDQVLQEYYKNNRDTAVRKQNGKSLQLTFAQVKQEIYEVLCEEYWRDYIKNWNEDMKKKYDVKYNEDGIRLLMNIEKEYLNKIIEPMKPNLALFKESSASSALRSENNPDLAFDGKQETAWIPAAADSPQWIAVDLGEKKQFRKIVLSWGKNFPASFTILASDDGHLWRDIFLVNKSTGGGNEVNEILLERFKKRFIKILINENTGYTLKEFEVYH